MKPNWSVLAITGLAVLTFVRILSPPLKAGDTIVLGRRAIAIQLPTTRIEAISETITEAILPVLAVEPPSPPPSAAASTAQRRQRARQAPRTAPLSSIGVEPMQLAEERTTPFPVVMLAHARPDRLAATLASLVQVRGLDHRHVFIVQDGEDESVASVVRNHSVRLVQLPAINGGAQRADPRGECIAKAYKRALSLAFDELTKDEAIVVVEDDLLFSPDLMEFFLAGFAVMRSDASLWCISAWHDNGFMGLTGGPAAARRLLRTGFFPGLGWLLTRALYKRELEPAWPREHWDHWMRSETVHRTSRGRECVIPQVPRTFHHGVRGTFMDPVLHRRYFGRIEHSTDASLRWPAEEFAQIRAETEVSGYERRLRARIAAARPLIDFGELLVGEGAGGTKGMGDDASRVGSVDSRENSPALALWYDMAPRDPSASVFKAIAKAFGLWHESRRGAHYGVHELYCRGRLVLLINLRNGAEAKPSPYAHLAPATDGTQPYVFRDGTQVTRRVQRALKRHPAAGPSLCESDALARVRT